MSTMDVEAGLTLPDGAALGAGELTEVIQTFNDVCARLQGTHEVLRQEVTRLQGELSDARRQLRRARELAALGEMAAGISHEIRNPLGSIRLYTNILIDDLEDRPEQRDLVQRIDAAVAGMNGIVNDVLDFARELHVSGEPVSSRDLLADAAASCADLVDEHDIAISIVDETDDRPCLVDASLVHQALVNVIRNACEALAESETPDPAVRLEIVSRAVLDAEGARHPMVALAVIDNGPGLPADVAERIFQPFFTTRHTGTGLGLAIVHRIIDAHGGRIAITSADGEPRLIARGDDPAHALTDADRLESAEAFPTIVTTTKPDGRGTRVELILPEPTRAINGEAA